MRKTLALIAALALAILVAACGQTDHGGYASAEEACASVGGTLGPGPVLEGDEAEFVCRTGEGEDQSGRIVEAPRHAVRGEDAENHINAWEVDEDSRVCADGQEADAEIGQRCGPEGVIDGAVGRPQQELDEGYYGDD